MKGNVECLILDYGCVISKPQDSQAVSEMAEIFQGDKQRFQRAYFKHRTNYDRGCTALEYWSAVAGDLGITLTQTQLDRLIALDCRSWTHLDQSMLDFAESQKPNLKNLAVLSNMPWDHLSYIKVRQNWFLRFDKLFFSCELGICKPEPEIYRLCLEKIPCSSDKCLFVDDSIANTEAAASLGMMTFHYTGFADFIKKWGS